MICLGLNTHALAVLLIPVHLNPDTASGFLVNTDPDHYHTLGF